MSLTAGAAQTATVPITVMPAGLSISTQVILSTDAAGNSLAATSAVQTFTSSGVAQAVSHPLTAPGAGTYYVGVAVKVAGNLVGIWTQPNIVVVAPIPYWQTFNYRVWAYENGQFAGAAGGAYAVLTGPGGTFSGYTDMGGWFNIPSIPHGNYQLAVTFGGFHDINGNWTYSAGIALNSPNGNNTGLINMYWP